MTRELVTTDESSELAVIEATAREEFNNACYLAQSRWHNTNEELHREFQDAIEDNNAAYRTAMTMAQRNYRNQTADQYADA